MGKVSTLASFAVLGILAISAPPVSSAERIHVQAHISRAVLLSGAAEKSRRLAHPRVSFFALKAMAPPG
jgi:hypothetical protein